MVNEKEYTISSPYVKKILESLAIARAGYQNSTCEEERFKNPLRGECRCIAPLKFTYYSNAVDHHQ